MATKPGNAGQKGKTLDQQIEESVAFKKKEAAEAKERLKNRMRGMFKPGKIASDPNFIPPPPLPARPGSVVAKKEEPVQKKISEEDIQWVINSVKRSQNLYKAAHENKRTVFGFSLTKILPKSKHEKDFQKIIDKFENFQEKMIKAINTFPTHDPFGQPHKPETIEKEKNNIIRETFQTMTEYLQSTFEGGFKKRGANNEGEFVTYLNSKPEKSHFFRLLGIQLNRLYKIVDPAAHPKLGEIKTPYGKHTHYLDSPAEVAKQDKMERQTRKPE